jgi:hypothetical protein
MKTDGKDNIILRYTSASAKLIQIPLHGFFVPDERENQRDIVVGTVAPDVFLSHNAFPSPSSPLAKPCTTSSLATPPRLLELKDA